MRKTSISLGLSTTLAIFQTTHYYVAKHPSDSYAKKRLVSSTIPKRIYVFPQKYDVKKKELSDELDWSLDSVVISDDIESSWKSLIPPLLKFSDFP